MMPLTGKRVLVTRPRTQAAELCDKLIALGAAPIVFPTIEIAPLEDPVELDRAIRSLAQYHWVIFTSVNGVNAFWDRWNLSGLAPLRSASGVPRKDLTGFPVKFSAIGPATARALEKHGVTATLIPDACIPESIFESIGDVKGQPILRARADTA